MTGDAQVDPSATREVLVAQRLVELAGTRGEDAEDDVPSRLVTDCLDLLGVDGAAVVVSDPAGAPSVTASAEQVSRVVEAGSGHPEPAWSDDTLRAHGFSALYPFSLAHRAETVGGLYLLLADAPALSASDQALAQALAGAAAIALLHRRSLAGAIALSDQLQTALDSRIVVEQATGVLSEYAGTGMGSAFDALRQYARSHRLKLRAVAERVVSRELDPSQVVGPRRER